MDPWQEWMAVLAREGRRVPDDAVPFAMRGFSWKMSVSVEGDHMGSQLIGRVSIGPDSGTALASMEPFGPVLHEGNTLWEMSLSNSGTAAFPDGGEARVDRYPFLLVLVPPNAPPTPLFGGNFTLIGAI